MARIARFIVPGLPHHVDAARQPARTRVLQRRRLCALSRAALASQCRKQGVTCWAYCLMPNPCTCADLRPRPERVAGARAWRDPPTLFDGDQCAARRDRASVPGAVRLGGDGRGASDGGGALRGVEPGQRAAGRAGGGTGVGRASARISSGRDDGLVSVAPLIERCGGRFADLIETAAARRGGFGAASGRDDRPTCRVARVSRSPCCCDRPRSAPQAAGAEAERGGSLGVE